MIPLRDIEWDLMLGLGHVRRWQVLPAVLVIVCALGGAAPDAARAQEPRVQFEVAAVEQVDGSAVFTVRTPASLMGVPTASVDGTPRAVEVTPTLRPAVVLVLETSSNMTQDQLRASGQAAAAFLRQLPPSTRVAVVTFDDQVRADGFASDIASAQAALGNVAPRGASALFDGLRAAGTVLDGVQRASASVVVVTAGWDWGSVSVSSRADSYAVVQALGAEVYPVIIGADFDTTLVTTLANPPRSAPWSLDDLGGGALAASVASGARVEYQVRMATAGLRAGAHEVTLGWDGPTAVTEIESMVGASMLAPDVSSPADWAGTGDTVGSDPAVSPVALRESVALPLVQRDEPGTTAQDFAVHRDTVRCTHCPGDALELQRLVRQDEYLEGWWLCLSCSRITYWRQAIEAWVQTASGADGLAVTPPTAATVGVESLVSQVEREMAAVTELGLGLWDAIERTECLLEGMRTLQQQLRGLGPDPDAVERPEHESSAA